MPSNFVFVESRFRVSPFLCEKVEALTQFILHVSELRQFFYLTIKSVAVDRSIDIKYR